MGFNDHYWCPNSSEGFSNPGDVITDGVVSISTSNVPAFSNILVILELLSKYT